MTISTMMGIDSPTGSHLPALTEAVNALPPGALVIEHGAGLYSTPLLAKCAPHVLCVEPHEGWREWARWIYSMGAARVEMGDSFKRAVPRLTDAAVVFIDGPAPERGPLLHKSLEAGVPTIIVHDTEEREWDFYGHKRHFFEWPKYQIAHTAEHSHRTTTWRRLS